MIVVAVVAVGVGLAIAVPLLDAISPKCDQFATVTTKVQRDAYAGVVNVTYTSSAGNRAALFTAFSGEGQRLVAAGYTWGGAAVCTPYQGSQAGQSVRQGVPFDAAGRANQAGSSASVGAWLPPGASGDRHFCAAQYFDISSTRWVGVVTRHVEVPAVVDFVTTSGPWHQVCLDLEREQMQGVLLLTTVLVVLAAVGVLFTVRRL